MALERFKINQSDFYLNGTFSSRYLQIEFMVIFIKERREMNSLEYPCESVLDACPNMCSLQNPCELGSTVSMFYSGGNTRVKMLNTQCRVVQLPRVQAALDVCPASPSPSHSACECEGPLKFLSCSPLLESGLRNCRLSLRSKALVWSLG